MYIYIYIHACKKQGEHNENKMNVPLVSVIVLFLVITRDHEGPPHI
jgi:hypothetical protein